MGSERGIFGKGSPKSLDFLLQNTVGSLSTIGILSTCALSTGAAQHSLATPHEIVALGGRDLEVLCQDLGVVGDDLSELWDPHNGLGIL